MKKIFYSLIAAVLLAACSHETNESTDASVNDTLMAIPGEEHEAPAAPAENPYKDAKIDIRVFNNDTVPNEPKLSGFGYNILIYDAVYNHQPHIPAINGMRGFNTAEQAQSAATLVVHKIRNNIMPPSLSPQELDSIGALK